MVDIGGGVGHDLLGVKARHPNLKGRLVLEELPHVIKQVEDKLEGISLVKHDFYTLQPIKGGLPHNLVRIQTEAISDQAYRSELRVSINHATWDLT